jgi:hypothetical protein
MTVYNRGLFIQIEKLDEEGNILGQENNEYIYPEKEYIDNIQALLEWAKHYMDNVKVNKQVIVSIVYYKVDNLSVVRIKRDRVWFANILPVLEKEWKKILYYKTGNNYTKLIEQDSRSFDSKFIDVNINNYYSPSTSLRSDPTSLRSAPPGLTKQTRQLDFSDSEDEN